MRKLDMVAVEQACRDYTKEQLLEKLRSQQVAVYVMCEGGLLGRFAAEQPADFYIDMRVSRLPYGRRKIEQAVAVLVVLAKLCGFSGKGTDMPKMPDLHGSGIW